MTTMRNEPASSGTLRNSAASYLRSPTTGPLPLRIQRLGFESLQTRRVTAGQGVGIGRLSEMITSVRTWEANIPLWMSLTTGCQPLPVADQDLRFDMTRLGYQIPNFTYPDTAPGETFNSIVAQAKAAEAAGFDRVMVMDHFYQLPFIGSHDEPMFECYSILAALAQHTESVQLSALVTSNTYRHPTLLAKTVTALDHVSDGRAILGIGAGWFELEHASLGYDFGTVADRFERLEESLQILRPMLRGQPVTFHGRHYRISEAINSPAPISRIPIMVGGSGEKKTLRLAARYAEESDLGGVPVDQIPRKLDALAAHCDRLGRERSDIVVTKVAAVIIGPTFEQAEADLEEMAALKGWSGELVEMAKAILIFGDPDTVGEQLRAAIDAGLDGLTLNLPMSGHKTDRIALLGSVALAATE